LISKNLVSNQVKEVRMKLLVRIFAKVTMYTFLGYALFMIRLVGGGQTLLSLLLISFTVTALIYCCTVIESFLKQRKKSNRQ